MKHAYTTLAYPLIAVEKVTVVTLVLVPTMDCGIITALLELYTCTKGYWLLRL